MIKLIFLYHFEIIGACPEGERPATNVQRKNCVPACVAPLSLCDRGECICPHGFEGVYAGGQLQQCNRAMADVSHNGEPLYNCSY